MKKVHGKLRRGVVVKPVLEQTEALEWLCQGVKGQRWRVRGHTEANGNKKVELLRGSLRGKHFCLADRFILGSKQWGRTKITCSIQQKSPSFPVFVRARYPQSPPVFIQLCPQAPTGCLIIRGLCDGRYSTFIHNAWYSVSYIRRAGDDSLPHLISQRGNMGTQRRFSLHEHWQTYTFEGLTSTNLSNNNMTSFARPTCKNL